MTNKANPDRPTEQPDPGRFIEDWTAMWRAELQAQTNDPEAMAGAIEMWRAAMAAWTDAFGIPAMRMEPPFFPAKAWPNGASEQTGPPRTQTAFAAPDARDAAIERLARRVDELEARLAELEAARRRPG